MKIFSLEINVGWLMVKCVAKYLRLALEN